MTTLTIFSKDISYFKLEIKAWYLLSNGWEYFVIENPDKNGIGEALVEGFEQEIGSFSFDEIRPYIVCSATGDDLLDLDPPANWLK